jgi:hypothetical protein
MYKIQKDIPLVSRKKYSFEEMNIGDSFLVPSSDLPEKSKGQSIRSVALRYSKKTGKKFKVSKVEGGIRVWRIS